MHSYKNVQDCLFNPSSRSRVGLFASRSSVGLFDRAKQFTASFEFSAPADRHWSIGFLYHDSGWGNRAWTYVYRDGDELFARHITREDDAQSHTKRSGPFELSLVDYGPRGVNQMSIRVDGSGASLTLNDSVVMRVRSSMMAPVTGSSVLCVGFEHNEVTYSIAYSKLKADRLDE